MQAGRAPSRAAQICTATTGEESVPQRLRSRERAPHHGHHECGGSDGGIVARENAARRGLNHGIYEGGSEVRI